MLRCELAGGFPPVAHPGTLHTSTLQCYSSWGFLPYHFIARVRPRLAWICWNKFITNYILVVLVECIMHFHGDCHVMFTILPNDKTTGDSHSCTSTGYISTGNPHGSPLKHTITRNPFDLDAGSICTRILTHVCSKQVCGEQSLVHRTTLRKAH